MIPAKLAWLVFPQLDDYLSSSSSFSSALPSLALERPTICSLLGKALMLAFRFRLLIPSLDFKSPTLTLSALLELLHVLEFGCRLVLDPYLRRSFVRIYLTIAFTVYVSLSRMLYPRPMASMNPELEQGESMVHDRLVRQRAGADV